MNNVLSVEFLEGAFKRSYILTCISQNEVQVAGIPWMDTYNLEVDLELLRFWNYVKSRYGINSGSQEVVEQLVPLTAIINRKKLNQNSSFWEHQLVLSDCKQQEVIIFHPHTCSLNKEENE